MSGHAGATSAPSGGTAPLRWAHSPFLLERQATVFACAALWASAVTRRSAGCGLPRGLALTACDPQSVLSVLGCVLACPRAPSGLGWLSTLSPTGPSGCFSLCDAIHQGVVRVHGTAVRKLFPLNYGAPEEFLVRLIITCSPERLRTPETDHCRCSWKEDALARHSLAGPASLWETVGRSLSPSAVLLWTKLRPAAPLAPGASVLAGGEPAAGGCPLTAAWRWRRCLPVLGAPGEPGALHSHQSDSCCPQPLSGMHSSSDRIAGDGWLLDK